MFRPMHREVISEQKSLLGKTYSQQIMLFPNVGQAGVKSQWPNSYIKW